MKFIDMDIDGGETLSVEPSGEFVVLTIQSDGIECRVKITPVKADAAANAMRACAKHLRKVFLGRRKMR